MAMMNLPPRSHLSLRRGVPRGCAVNRTRKSNRSSQFRRTRRKLDVLAANRCLPSSKRLMQKLVLTTLLTSTTTIIILSEPRNLVVCLKRNTQTQYRMLALKLRKLVQEVNPQRRRLPIVREVNPRHRHLPKAT